MRSAAQHFEELGRYAYQRDVLVRALAWRSQQLDAAISEALADGLCSIAVADAAGVSRPGLTRAIDRHADKATAR